MKDKLQSLKAETLPLWRDKIVNGWDWIRAFFREQVELERNAQAFDPFLYPFRRLRTIVLASGAFFLVALIWASFAQLDEVTRGDGKVIPSSEVQVVQHLEGGIVESIDARPGDIVEADQVLIRLQRVVAETDYRQARAQFLSLTASIARLEAQMAGEDYVVPDLVQAEAPDIARDELENWRLNKAMVDSQVEVLRQQAVQRTQEILELQERSKKGKEALALMQREEALLADLVARGVAAEVELLRLRRAIVDKENEIQGYDLAIPRAEAAAAEAEQRVLETEARIGREASTELNEQKVDLSKVIETIRAYEDRVIRTEVKSPVRGIIKDMRVNTVGGVVRPGEDIIEIVPLEDTLLIEARVRPSDIAFLHPGQPAMVRITAYDPTTYGGMDATLVDISADTITNEEGESFYRVRLRTDSSQLEFNGQSLAIMPGMTATVDIITGEKSVLAYLVKPLIRGTSLALSER